ncbi:MAG: hypothetical protein ABF868_00540 [Sporolactobacillus sp.]
MKSSSNDFIPLWTSQFVHCDATAYTLYGACNSENVADEKLKMMQGYSKQHRPCLKQIVIGVAVTPEQIPVYVSIEDENTDDKKWNLSFIKK